MAADAAAETIACPACDAANPADHRFCGTCGAPLTRTCPDCGKTSPASNRFCGGCGKPFDVSPAEPETQPVAPIPEPTPLPKPAAPPPSPRPPLPDLPTDPLARERELQSLLARANLQRMRALISDARRTLEIALVVADTLPPAAGAPVHEMIGDMLAAEERWEQARDAYAQALACNPEKASAERKYGEMVVKINDAEAMARLGGPLAGDDLVDVLRDGRPGRRNGGMAMLCSLALPGGGQFYSGQFVKGGIILGVALLSLLLVALSPDRGALIEQIGGFVAAKPPRHADSVPLVLWFCLGAGVLAWLYGIGDAPLSAGKDRGQTFLNPAPMGSRSDWEP